MKKFKILPNQLGLRLDKFLVLELSSLSRNLIQHLISDGSVIVNGQPESANYKLKIDDEVEVLSLDRREKLQDDFDMSIFEQVQVIAETPDYLIVNKPAGLIIHGSKHLPEPSLVDWLLKTYPEINGVGEDAERPGIVHRIDKDVSGLVVVARNQASFKHFKKLFAYRRIKKIYTALVYDKVARDADTIEFVIERSTSGHKMAARPVNQEGKPSISEFTVTKRFINFTQLDISIKTGRTHQIRAHLSAYGHPIVGDNLYGTHRNKLMNAKLGTDRIFLVARRLAFKDLAGTPVEYEIELPVKFVDLLGKIK